jgi:hypothetical protein
MNCRVPGGEGVHLDLKIAEELDQQMPTRLKKAAKSEE